MKKVLLAAALLLTFVAMPAFASVQNVKVSGDIGSYYLVRNQWDLGSRTQTEQARQNIFFSQTRLRVDSDLTDNVSASVGLLNERVWGTAGFQSNSTSNANDNGVDIYNAYVTLKEMLYSPLTVVIGRQNFAFGNSFVIDSLGRNNSTSTQGLKGVAEDFTLSTAQDAVRLILDYNPLKIDIIGSKVSSGKSQAIAPHNDDIDLWGTNAAYQLGDKWQTLVEAYYWAKLDKSALNAAGPGAKTDTVYMPGIHASTNPIKGLNLSAEIAMQRGNKLQTASGSFVGNVKREATGAQVIANYQVPIAQIEKYKPALMAAYTYVSGEKNPVEGGTHDSTRYSGWDPMFENQGGGQIYSAMWDLTGVDVITAKASAKPLSDLTAMVQLDYLWLDKRNHANLPVKQGDGTTLSLGSTTNRYLGYELGLGVSYAYTDDVSFGAKYDVFDPGNAFSSNNRNTASQFLVNANVNF